MRPLEPALVWLAAFFCCSCGSAHRAATIATMAELAPETVPGKSADLILAGTSYPVQLVVKRNQDRMELILENHDEPFEIERYEVGSNEFSLLDAAEEHFWDPLPLLKFPLRMGEGWTWVGTMTTGQIPRRATAKIVPSSETLFISGVSYETIKVDVDLSLYANMGKTPLKRSLDFWFEPKGGLIKRAFGTASVRQPQE
jgi:hypothetical protein